MLAYLDAYKKLVTQLGGVSAMPAGSAHTAAALGSLPDEAEGLASDRGAFCPCRKRPSS